MNKNPRAIRALALILCCLSAAGCANIPSASHPPPPAAGPHSAVSFKATPVHHATVNGVALGYREFGAGEPLLMIQGFGNTINDWNETFIGILATKYHVYTYDHRGMGYSSGNQTTPSIPQYADDAVGLMTALGYHSMHIYGVSMGSLIAQRLAIHDPDRVRKVVLDSTAYSIWAPETQKLLEAVRSSAADPAQPAGIHQEAEANLAWKGLYDGLAGIHQDVLLMVGTADILTPDSISVLIAGQISGAWLVRFKGLPHDGSRIAPVEYAESALAFLGVNQSPLKQ